MRNTSLVLIALTVQATIVAAMLISAVMPLWTGREVMILAKPVDPRDLMRGDFVSLDYDFNHLNIDTLKTDFEKNEFIRYGADLYVALRTTTIGTIATGVFKEPPTSGLFIKGHCAVEQNVTTVRDGSNSKLYIDFGIEEYFTDSQTAKQLEKELSDAHGVPVVVMIDNNGNARIRTIGYRPNR